MFVYLFKVTLKGFDDQLNLECARKGKKDDAEALGFDKGKERILD